MMQTLIDRHLHCTRVYKKQLLALTRPLFARSPVKYFSYNRYYRDQKWIGLYTDDEPVAKSLAMDSGPLFVDDKGVAIDAGIYFHGDIKEIIKTTVVSDEVERFFTQKGNQIGESVVHNGLLIIRKGNPYDESFYFSMLDTSIGQSRAYYYQAIALLKRFCLYFLHRGKDVIQTAESYKIRYALPRKNESADLFWKDVDCGDINWFDSKKFCFGTSFGDVFVSFQELNCLRLIACGHSYKEIADKLKLHLKTVETYITSLKNKFNADSRAELIALYRQFSVLDAEIPRASKIHSAMDHYIAADY